jgi:putative two-component system response regulator
VFLIGQELELGEGFLTTLLLASPMHDVGKIGIPDAILLKLGRLTRAEFEVVKDHALIGARLLAGSQSPLLRMAETIARTHHEFCNGQGYPFGLSGEAIPLAGRIAAVADVFDALTSRRPYKVASTAEVAVWIIRRGSGSRFDPEVVQAFRRALSGILEVKGEFEDHGPTQGRGSSAGVGGGVVEKLAATEERFLRTREPSMCATTESSRREVGIPATKVKALSTSAPSQ